MVGSDEFRDIVVRADHYLQNIGVIPGYAGATVGEMMQQWTKTIPTR